MYRKPFTFPKGASEMKKFVSFLVKILACVLAVFTPMQAYRRPAVAQTKSSLESAEAGTLRLISEYRKNILLDISADGRLLLFYQTGTPTRSFSIPLGGGKGRANQPNTDTDLLRVVERESGREVAHVAVRFFPANERFVPGAHQVFYSEPKPDSREGSEYKLWDFASGGSRVCIEGPQGGFAQPTFLDEHRALGTIWRQGSNSTLSESSLGELILPNCSLKVAGTIDPDDPQRGIRGHLALSPAKHHLAYALRGTMDEVLIREANTLSLIKGIKAPQGLYLGNLVYTPDGSRLMIIASNTVYDRPDTRRYILFYETTNYSLVRRFDVTGSISGDIDSGSAVNSGLDSNAIALSPDGRMLAVGHRERRNGVVEAFITLHDIETGRVLAKASYPRLDYNHNDPFTSKITNLVFTPDGRYLLSSTYDTRVWQIKN